MFSFFRRRKPISLGILEREPAATDVAGVESAVSEPDQEKLAVAESNLVDLPPAVSEPDEPAAKSTPAKFAPSGAAVSNLYAIPNAGVKYAIEQKIPEEPAVETGRESDSPPAENPAETSFGTEEGLTAAESVVSEEVIVATDATATQSVPEETPNETEGDQESPAAEVLPAESVADQESGAAEELLAVEEPVVAEETPAEQSATERTRPELDSNLESSAPEAPLDEPIAPDWSDHVAESVTAEESVVIGEPIAAEETPVVESNPAVAMPVENPANELPIAESADDLTSINSDAPVVASESPSVDSSAPEAAEIESSSSEQVALDLAHRLAVLEDTVRQHASAAPSKPKRRWWSFWRKPHTAEQSVIAGELSAIDSPVVEAVNENSAPEDIAVAEQVTVEQFQETESDNVDLSPDETLAGEAPASEVSAAISSIGSDIHAAADIAEPPDAPASHEVAEVELQTAAPFSLDLAEIDPAAVKPQPEEKPAAAGPSEIPVPDYHATEVAEVGSLSTTAESKALENIQIESAASETEQIAPPLDAEPTDSAVAKSVAEAGTAEISLTESVDAASVAHEPTSGPAASEPSPVEIGTFAELASPEVSEQEDAISVAAQDDPGGNSPAVEEEEVNPSVSEVHEDSPSIVRLSDQSNHSSGGLLDLPRVAEPEVMDDSEEVEAYASATAQAWLDKIDDSFVEHATRLVKGRQRGRALDIGTGPGQIALKLALRLSLWKVIGVDRSQKMIEEALAKLAATAPVTGRLEFRIADGNRLDFPDATFDLVICNSVLHHFAEPRNLLAELARVTKRRGAILLRDLRRPSRLMYPFHVRWHGRNYEGAMGKLYRDSVRAAYTVPELQRLLDSSPLRGAQVFRHGSTHIGLERPYNW